MIGTLASAARIAAILIAAAAVIDPAIPLPHVERPALQVSVAAPNATPVEQALRDAGFRVNTGETEAATVLVTREVPPHVTPNTWVLDASPAAPNIRIVGAATSSSRIPGQALDVLVTVEGHGFAGKSAELALEDSGIPVATARHQWSGNADRWSVHMQYLPVRAGAGRLRARLAPLPGETAADDNIADIAMPPMRGPVRTLIVEAAVTWPALFVRRALEGESAFAVSSTQRASKNVATRAGGPPAALTREALAPFEVVVLGGPDALSRPAVDALRWFVENRGGIVILVPDRQPAGEYLSLLGVNAFQLRALEMPVRLGPDLLASEFAVARTPADAEVVAADPQGNAVVFARRRGAGAVLFSGAFDAWRYRGQDGEGFARFWRRLVASAALTVPPVLDVSVSPALARPGDSVRVSARVRDAELLERGGRVEVNSVQARAIRTDSRMDAFIRLWPTAEPGVFAGAFTVPAPGNYDISVATDSLRGDATLIAAPDVAVPSAASSDDFDLLARSTGGRAFPLARWRELVDAIASAFPAKRITRATHLMRSPWWCVPFAALLCAEWAVRRKRGRP